MTKIIFVFVFIVVVLTTLIQSAKVCPGYGFIRPPTNCESSCSMEKDECPNDKKCCFRVQQPCGFHCIVPKDNQTKSGKCPSTSSDIKEPYWGICDGHFCDVDNDCQGNKKCCVNPCGSPICLSPQ